MAPRRGLPALALVLCASLTCHALAEPVALTDADVDVQSGSSAVAVCQLLVLVRSVIVLGLEDGLGLVSARVNETAHILLPPDVAQPATTADCEIDVERLRVVRPGGVPQPSYVLGPPPADPDGARVVGWRVSVAGAGSSVALCQRVVLVESIIIGGGAFGLPSGEVVEPIVVPPASPGYEAHASCRVRVGSVEISSA